MATATVLGPAPTPALASPEDSYEVVKGRVVETPPMGNHENWLERSLFRSLDRFADAEGLGRVAFQIIFRLDFDEDNQRRPDVAFISYDRWPRDRRMPKVTPWDMIPDLAVEVISPTNTTDNDLAKVEEYFRAGVRLVWQVLPGRRKVQVFESPASSRFLGVGDDLDGGAVVPGFRMPLAELFEEEDA